MSVKNESQVSVIIPLYNKVSTIGRAVRSVLLQTIQNYEVIVVDDGSNDSSGDVVKDIKDKRVKLIRQDNQGVSAARNKGIKCAKTNLVAFLDADDSYNSQFLETILRMSKQYPKAGSYSTAYEIVKKNGKTIKPNYKNIPPPPWEGIIPSYFKAALELPPVCSSATAVPMYVFDNVGRFPEGEKKAEDLDMWLRIALNYHMAFSWYVGAKYHLDVDARACDLVAFTGEPEVLKTGRKALSLNKVREHEIESLKEYMDLKRLDTASDLIKAGKNIQAKKMLRDCSTYHFVKRKSVLSFLAAIPTNIISTILRFRCWLEHVDIKIHKG